MDQPKDHYPAFTFCFSGGPDFVYSDAIKELQMSKEEYSMLLRGDSLYTNYTEGKWQRAVEISNQRFSIQIQRMLWNIHFKTKEPSKSFVLDKKVDDISSFVMEDLPFYISYQDPDKICFTRKQESDVGLDFLRLEDHVEFDATYLKGAHFLLYIHYPGQFSRNIQRPVFETTLDVDSRSKTQLHGSLTYIGVLRKRPGSNIPCNPDLKDDDNEFKLRVIKEVGCIPAYWRLMVKKNYLTDLCTTSNQLKSVYNHLKHPAGIMSLYQPPCDEMQALINVQETKVYGKKVQTLKIVIRYSTEIYQEIQNFRDYNLDTLWSSVGGFIGIFLGYSLLQLPELLQLDWETYWTLIRGNQKRNTRQAMLIRKRKHITNILRRLSKLYSELSQEQYI